MNFSEITNINIPEGNVIKITDSNGIVLWVKKGVEPDTSDIPNNEIWYTSTDRKIIELYDLPSDNTLISNTYKNGIGKMVFEKDLTELVEEMFSYERNLETIILPNSITSIGKLAFFNCSLLQSITCESLTAPTLGDSVFNGLPEVGTLYINKGASGYDVWLEQLPDGFELSYITE